MSAELSTLAAQKEEEVDPEATLLRLRSTPDSHRRVMQLQAEDAALDELLEHAEREADYLTENPSPCVLQSSSVIKPII